MAFIPTLIPTINLSNQIKPKKIPGGFVCAICFQLPAPAPEDGHIIQRIFQYESGTVNGLNTYQTVDYWEAWAIKKGERQPQQSQTIRDFISLQKGTVPSDGEGGWDTPMNDIFYRKFPLGGKRHYDITGCAGFYTDPLPEDFVVGNALTGAGGLKSTTRKPPFWLGNFGLVRQVRFDFIGETEADYKDTSKGKPDWSLPTEWDKKKQDALVKTGEELYDPFKPLVEKFKTSVESWKSFFFPK